MATNIGVSRKQRVFAVAEVSPGTLVFPSGSGATLGFVRVAGDAVVNQTPDFSDSPEKLDTLDIVDQFQGAMPSGTFTLPTLVRAGDAVGQIPQGDALFISMFGKQSTVASSSYCTDLNNAGIFYMQRTYAPSFSLWVETDHFVQGLSGCTVTNATLTISNEGAVQFNFSGEGMQMVFAGTDMINGAVASGAGTIHVTDASRFSASARIYNKTASLNNSDAGYTITASNATSNILTVTPVVDAAWASGASIAGFLPDETTIGTPIEGKDTSLTLNSVSAKFKTTEITIDVPKTYFTDEVGTDFPEDYAEGARSITSTLNIYFRKADAKYFREGYSGYEIPIRVTFGNVAGKTMVLHMQKTRLQVPAITFNAPAVELSIPMKALGTAGEDSAELCFI